MIIQCKACNKSFNVPDNAITASGGSYGAPAGTNGRNFPLKQLKKLIKEKQKLLKSKEKKISKKIKK